MVVNGNRYQLKRIVFALVDSILVLAAFVLGVFLRFYPVNRYAPVVDYLSMKIMVVVCIVQLSFYFFDLHDFKLFADERR